MVGCTRTVSVKELFILKGYWDVQTANFAEKHVDN